VNSALIPGTPRQSMKEGGRSRPKPTASRHQSRQRWPFSLIIPGAMGVVGGDMRHPF
jgi:hypothetical protein